MDARNPRGFRYFSDLIREGIADGSLRPDLDPMITLHTVIDVAVGGQRRLASLGRRVEVDDSRGDEVFRRTQLAHVRRLKRPYVSVWIEDKDRFPIRTVALWYDGKARWLPDLRGWYRADRLRWMAEGTQIVDTLTLPTRPSGKSWDRGWFSTTLVATLGGENLR